MIFDPWRDLGGAEVEAENAVVIDFGFGETDGLCQIYSILAGQSVAVDLF